MTSPSYGLIWEIWRKNRWGFALLGVLLGLGIAVSRYAVSLQDRANALEASLPLTVGDSLTGTAILTPPHKTPRGAQDPRNLSSPTIKMDVRMMMRYGLLKGTGMPTNMDTSSTGSATLATSAPPAAVKSSAGISNTMDPRMMLRYGLPRGYGIRGGSPSAHPPAEPPKPQVVRLSFGTNVIYTGTIGPEDLIAWSGVREREGIVQFTLNGRKLFEGPLNAGLARMTMTGFKVTAPNAVENAAEPAIDGP